MSAMLRWASLSRPTGACFLVGCAFLVSPRILDAQSWVISGAVTDTAGSPIAGADIDIAPSGGGLDLSLSGDATGVDGTFSLTILDVVLSGFYDIQINPPVGSQYIGIELPGFFLSGSTDLGAFVLLIGWNLSGHVADESGLALEGIDLELSDANGVEIAVQNDDTDALGNYSIVVPEGTWDVVFRQPTPGPVSYVAVLVPAVDLAADVVLPDIVMQVGYALTGHVEDATGSPVSGVDVDLHDAATDASIHTEDDNSNASGDFSVVAPAGALSLLVRPPPGILLVPQIVAITVAAPPATNDAGTITLPVGVEISGRVLDDSLEPEPSVDLDLVLLPTEQVIDPVQDDTNAMGEFAVVVEPGDYDVRVRPAFASGLAPMVLTGISASASIDLGDIELAAGAAVTGTALAAGAGLEGVAVTATDAATGTPVYLFGNVTGADGGFAIRIASGTYDFLFTPPAATGLASVELTDVVIAGDSMLDVDFGGTPPPPPAPSFLRGDPNSDGNVNLADAIFLLQWQFNNGSEPTCIDAADANDDGFTNIADAIRLLSYLFQEGISPPPPFPACGEDGTTSDTLSCASYDEC